MYAAILGGVLLATLAVLAVSIALQLGAVCLYNTATARPEGTVYTGTAQGMFCQIEAKITVSEGKIVDVTLTGAEETPTLGGKVMEEMPAKIVDAQSADVDGMAGATITTNAVKDAVKEAMTAAGLLEAAEPAVDDVAEGTAEMPPVVDGDNAVMDATVYTGKTTAPKTCLRCGTTSGSALERKKSETTLPENNAAIAGTLQPHPTGENYSGVRFSVFDSGINRSEIRSISFLGSKDLAPFFAWDVSEEQDGSVVAWVEGDSGNYKLYIAANGQIRVRSCKELFAFYLNAEKIEFNGVLDTSQATDMFRMFQGCDNLTSLDLSSFDTSRVTEMSEMFDSCGKLSNLNLSGFNTSRVENMIGMFRGCPKLTRLDLSSFDFSNVRYYDEFMNEDATVNGMPWKRLFS